MSLVLGFRLGRSLELSALSFVIILGISLIGVGEGRAQAFTESFDTVASNTATPVPGWTAKNNSSPTGTTGWYQSNPAVITPQSGGAISANFNSTTGTNTISNWLITPNRTFSNGDVITFYTRTVANPAFGDRLQVRRSAAGTSVNVGTLPTDVGDFTNLLLDINPTYSISGYPSTMTLYTITISGLAAPTSGRLAFRYFVEGGGPLGDNSDTIGIDTFAYSPAGSAPQQNVGDYDGDGKTDPSVVRNTGGGPAGQLTWFHNRTTGGPVQYPWGLNTDVLVPEDYDGDNKTDIAVWRGGPPFGSFFIIFNSSTGTVSQVTFGQTGDDPTVVGDYTGDGKADAAVFRPAVVQGAQSSFWVKPSSGPLVGQDVQTRWGTFGDVPVQGDFNGDGINDFCVRRNNGGGQAVFLRRNGTGGADNNGPVSSAVVFGTPTDLLVPLDYDGDGMTDIAVARASGGFWNWYIRKSTTGAVNDPPVIWGLSTDRLTPGDWDGDGRADPAVWRENADPTMNFFLWRGTTSGPIQTEWGQMGDRPSASFSVR